MYAIEEEMALRRDRLNSVCQRLSTEKPPLDTGEFVVDAHHSLVWCKVLKAASTTWINYFNVLGKNPLLKKTNVLETSSLDAKRGFKAEESSPQNPWYMYDQEMVG